MNTLLVEGVSFAEAEVVNGEIKKKVVFVAIDLPHNDVRFNNIEASLMKDDHEFRKCCGVYALCKCESGVVELSDKLLYMTLDEGEYVFGKLTMEELNRISEYLILNADEVKDSQVITKFTEKEFKEVYHEYFKL